MSIAWCTCMSASRRWSSRRRASPGDKSKAGERRMADQSHICAGVAGYVGRPEERGKIGVFRRAAVGGEWQHVLSDLETHALLVHPTDPNVVFAGTADGVWRRTDFGATFQRASFPDKVQMHGTIMSVALHATDPSQVYIGARYQGEIFGTQDGGETWTAMPLPGPVKDIYAVACG